MARKPAAKPAVARKPSLKAAREIEAKPAPRSPALPVSRSVRFSEIIGQDRAIATLRSAVRAERIHHAWLFHGPTGVGKFTTALAFAGLLLDPTSDAGLSGEIEPDPESRTQALLRAGTHPDLCIVTKELAAVSRHQPTRDSKQRNIGIEVLREFLIEPAEKSGSATVGARASKVFIVDEAELLNYGANAAQNALLKTLEEPPPGCVVILVTSQEERLLPTIRSRSQRVAFGPLSDADMKAWLAKSGLDVSGLSEPSRKWVLSYAAGSPGVATLAVRTGLARWHETMSPMLAELDAARFPIDFGTIADALADEWATAWVERPGYKDSSKEAANQAAARQMLRLIAEHYRERMRSGGGKGAERSARAVELIAEAELQAESNVDFKFVLDNLGAQLALTRGE